MNLTRARIAQSILSNIKRGYRPANMSDVISKVETYIEELAGKDKSKREAMLIVYDLATQSEPGIAGNIAGCTKAMDKIVVQIDGVTVERGGGMSLDDVLNLHTSGEPAVSTDERSAGEAAFKQVMSDAGVDVPDREVPAAAPELPDGVMTPEQVMAGEAVDADE